MPHVHFVKNHTTGNYISVLPDEGEFEEVPFDDADVFSSKATAIAVMEQAQAQHARSMRRRIGFVFGMSRYVYALVTYQLSETPSAPEEIDEDDRDAA